MFFDFLTRSYDIGGVVSVMALSSLFILMTLHGLEYSYFYEKLLVSCLKSRLLLAYLAAAFAKKLSQLALSVLPAEALVIVAPIHNLLRRHLSINCLVHRKDGESKTKDDLKMEEQIVGNRNDSTGMDLSKKPSFDHFCDASGASRSLKPEVDLKVKSMNLLYILLVLSATKIAKKIKLKCPKAWISFLRLPLPLNVYKEVLVSLHQAVIPHLSNPIMLCNFLMRSYNIGGVVSVMALSSHFILLNELLDSCLKSPLLPAAAFAKKLSRLAPSVLPAGALVIVACIHNLLRWHPSMNRLVHRESSKKMSTRKSLLLSRPLLLLASVLSASFSVSLGDTGTAAYYKPSSSWTECYHDDPSQFPESKLFAAAGQNLWEGKVACGREYDVWCISEAQSGPGNCTAGSGPIRVKVLDSAESSACAPGQSSPGADLVLSETAFKKIAKPFVVSIKVRFKGV